MTRQRHRAVVGAVALGLTASNVVVDVGRADRYPRVMGWIGREWVLLAVGACILSGCYAVEYQQIATPPRALARKARVPVIDDADGKSLYTVGYLTVTGPEKLIAVQRMAARAAEIGCDAIVYGNEIDTYTGTWSSPGAGWAGKQEAAPEPKDLKELGAAIAASIVLDLVMPNPEARPPAPERTGKEVTRTHTAACVLDPATMIPWYEEDCGKANLDACSALAEMLDSGTGVVQNEHLASRYYVQGCDAKHLRACTKTWQRFRLGMSDAEQLGRAVAAFREACERADDRACAVLGAMNANGDGVVQDHEKALLLLSRACQRSHLGCDAVERLKRPVSTTPNPR